MTPRPLTPEGRAKLDTWLAEVKSGDVQRRNVLLWAARFDDAARHLLAAEAYWRERAERLAAAAEQAVLDGLAFDRMTGGLETLAEEIGIGTKEPQS